MEFTVNGVKYSLDVVPGAKLVDVLREQLGLTRVKVGCGDRQCGACTELVDDRPVRACMFPARRVEGGDMRSAFSYGVQAAQVAVGVRNGRVQVLRIVAARADARAGNRASLSCRVGDCHLGWAWVDKSWSQSLSSRTRVSGGVAC
jgi:hypothetical protein